MGNYDCAMGNYKGDRTTVENENTCSNITLGEIDLSAKGEYRYRLKGFSANEFTIGLQVTRLANGGAPIFFLKPFNADIRLRLRNERGEVVIDERANLDQWVWSGASAEPNKSHVYRRGRSVDIPVGRGFRVERVGVRADDGWGTYFDPRVDGDYQLEIMVFNFRPERIRIQGDGCGKIGLGYLVAELTWTTH